MADYMSPPVSRTANHDGMDPADRRQIDTYLAHLTVAGYPATTVATYRSALTRAAGSLPYGLGGALQEDLVVWLGSLGRPSASTYGAALRGFYAWCVRTGRLDADPAAGMPRTRHKPGLPRPISHDELGVILAGARPPVQLWARLAAYAGARCIEVARLDRADISEQVTYLHGKGDRDRIVPTHELVWEIARELPPGPVAAGQGPKAVSRTAADEFRRLGLAGVTMHRLRHWYATWTLAGTGNTRITQELLGHANLGTTQVYTAVTDGAKQAAVLGLPRVTSASGDGDG